MNIEQAEKLAIDNAKVNLEALKNDDWEHFSKEDIYNMCYITGLKMPAVFNKITEIRSDNSISGSSSSKAVLFGVVGFMQKLKDAEVKADLQEGMYSKTRDRTEQFMWDIFVDNKWGTTKWPCIADWEMTSDSIELVFDYSEKEEMYKSIKHGGLTASTMAKTTRESVERRLDSFMENEFTKLYNKELDPKRAWYKITPAGVDDDGSGIVVYSYNIASYNSYGKPKRDV